jgi:hypothetical protein
MLTTHADDECCARYISRALRDGLLDIAEKWVCPKCGQEWRPDLQDEWKHWSPYEEIVVIRKRQSG